MCILNVQVQTQYSAEDFTAIIAGVGGPKGFPPVRGLAGHYRVVTEVDLLDLLCTPDHLVLEEGDEGPPGELLGPLPPLHLELGPGDIDGDGD